MELEETPEVHFCNIRSKEAIVPLSTKMVDGVVIADIPNELLQQDLRILVYVYTYENGKGQTIHIGKIDVWKRTRPSDYTFEENINVVNTVLLDKQVQQLINREEEITNDIYELQKKSHSHNNQELLNEIDAERMKKWDTDEIELDETLTETGKAADAAVVGENIFYTVDETNTEYELFSEEDSVTLVVGTDVQISQIIKFGIGSSDVEVTAYGVADESAGTLPSENSSYYPAQLVSSITYQYIEVTNEISKYKISGAEGIYILKEIVVGEKKCNIQDLKNELDALKKELAELKESYSNLSVSMATTDDIDDLF